MNCPPSPMAVSQGPLSLPSPQPCLLAPIRSPSRAVGLTESKQLILGHSASAKCLGPGHSLVLPGPWPLCLGPAKRCHPGQQSTKRLRCTATRPTPHKDKPCEGRLQPGIKGQKDLPLLARRGRVFQTEGTAYAEANSMTGSPGIVTCSSGYGVSTKAVVMDWKRWHRGVSRKHISTPPSRWRG